MTMESCGAFESRISHKNGFPSRKLSIRNCSRLPSGVCANEPDAFFSVF